MKALFAALLQALRRIGRWLRDLIAGPEERECGVCHTPLEPGQADCPVCAKEAARLIAASPSRNEPLVLAPLARGRARAPRLETGRPRLAIDLGTSASAVAFKESAGRRSSVQLVDFGPLGEGRKLGAPEPRSSELIGSEIFEGDLTSGQKGTCLGRVARKLNRDQPDKGRYHTSVKRALEAHTLAATGLGESGLNPHLAVNLQHLVGAVFTELLLLAVVPRKSATWRCAQALADDDEALRGVGLTSRIRSGMDHWIRQAGLELFITVPNSFSRHEIEVLREGAIAAARALFDAVDAAPDRPIRVHTLREAEAIAWWEQFADRGEPADAQAEPHVKPATVGPERWLVFDMGAGTTDLALVEVRGSEIRLIRRSGVPLGGDDVDLTTLLYLANGDLREAAVEHLLDGAGARLENVGVTFGARPIAGITPRRAADVLDGVDPAVRQLLKQEARVVKEAWSDFVPPRMEESWLEWLPATLDLVEVQGKAIDDLADESLLEAPFWSDRYRLFVHLVTVGCCQALVDGGSADQNVDRVLISGRGAFLPGIERCLRAALSRAGLSGERTRWSRASQPPERAADTHLDSKLAVVRGAAVFSAAGRRRTAPARLADAITAEIQFSGALREEVFPVIPRNSQLDARGQCRRLYRLTDQPGAELPIRVYRQRVPEETVAAVDDLMVERLDGLYVSATRLCRRPLAFLTLSLGGASEFWLGFQVDEQNSRVDLFASEGSNELTRQTQPLVGLPADPTNPVTGLHSDWLWGGRM